MIFKGFLTSIAKDFPGGGGGGGSGPPVPPLGLRMHKLSFFKTLYLENSILGECLLISSLPGKALRKLVDIARLAERFNMHSQS